MKLLILSKENLALSVAEALSLLTPTSHKIINNYLFHNSKINLESRLAFTRSYYEILFTSSHKELSEKIKSFNWNRIYSNSFCVRTFNLKRSESSLASLIWLSLKNPNVKLKNATTNIHFFQIKNQIYATLLLGTNQENFNERKPHKRPSLHPSSLQPKLARAMINLTGIKSGKIIDPFCGSGGILLEASLMNLKPIGYDIDPDMIKRTNANLKHFKQKAIIKKENALSIKKPITYLVTDLPYALNTKSTDLNLLFISFLKLLEKNLKVKAVLGFPHFTNYKKLIRATTLKIEHEFKLYMHKSLSKNIVIVKP